MFVVMVRFCVITTKSSSQILYCQEKPSFEWGAQDRHSGEQPPPQPPKDGVELLPASPSRPSLWGEPTTTRTVSMATVPNTFHLLPDVLAMATLHPTTPGTRA